MKQLRRIFLIAASVAVAGLATSAFADTYPRKPITIVVAYPPGGDTDLLARIFAEKLSPRLGQTVVVENRAGATGMIGTSYVEKSPPDGYTLMLQPISYALAQLVMKASPSTTYDVLNGFTPIIEVAKGPIVLVTGARSGIKTFADAIAASKKNEVSYASAGSGSVLHVLGEMVNKSAGTKFAHIPYKGVMPAVSDALGGHIPLAYLSLGTVLPYLAKGELIPLAVADPQRSGFVPQTPTFKELGYEGVELATWYGVFGPRGMAADVVSILNKHMDEIVNLPDVKARLATIGVLPVGGPPGTLAKTNTSDYERVSRIVKEIGIKAD